MELRRDMKGVTRIRKTMMQFVQAARPAQPFECVEV